MSMLIPPLILMLAILSCKGGRYRRFIEWGPDLAPGSFCSSRQCCPGRDDSCTVEILGSVCYCDVFCNRTANDCCPDYYVTCQDVAPVTIGECCCFYHMQMTNHPNITCSSYWSSLWLKYTQNLL